MTVESEEILNNGCNLIKNGSHQVLRQLESGIVFVVDTEIQYDFADPDSMDDALDISKLTFDDDEGCARCPLYGQCLPTPSVVTDL